MPRLMTGAISERRFLLAGAVLVGVGYFFDWRFGQLPERDARDIGMTGLATVYLFFAQLVYIGFAMAVLAMVRRPTLVSIGLTLLSSIIPIITAVVYGRREPTALFLLTIGLGFYFVRRILPPRLIVVSVILVTAIFIPATGVYRGVAATESPLQAVLDTEFLTLFADYIESAAAPELTNAIFTIEATSSFEVYDFGAGYWNQVVFRYVPAQFLGEDVKRGMMLPVEDDVAARYFHYSGPIGSTLTGIADAFKQFGYFGCLFFALLAWVNKNLWAMATRNENMIIQVLYVFNVTSSIRSLTHQTVDYLPGLLYAAIFLWVVWVFARRRGVSTPREVGRHSWTR
jgi:hypothetical protein